MSKWMPLKLGKKPVGKVTSVANADGGIMVTAEVEPELYKTLSGPASWSTSIGSSTWSSSWSTGPITSTTSTGWSSSWAPYTMSEPLTEEQRAIVQDAIAIEIASGRVHLPRFTFGVPKGTTGTVIYPYTKTVLGTGTSTTITFDSSKWDET